MTYTVYLCIPGTDEVDSLVKTYPTLTDARKAAEIFSSVNPEVNFWAAASR